MAMGKMVKVFRAKKQRRGIGINVPKDSKVLTRSIDKAQKNNTMFGPIQNLKSNMKRMSILENIGPFGTRWAGKLKYCTTLQMLTAAAGGYTEHQINLNSLYDPDRTGVGHQPLGFDQLAVIYSRYRVLKTTYRLTMCPRTAQNVSFGVVTYVNNSTVSLAAVDRAIEAGYSTFSLSNVFSSLRARKGAVDLPRLTGVSLAEYRGNNDQYASAVGASPTENLILHVGTEAIGGVQVAIDAYLELEFDCEFFDPPELAQS